MKHMLYRTAAGTDVEIDTDHAHAANPLKRKKRSTMCRHGKRGLIYVYGNVKWTGIGLADLFQWVRTIDDTVTPDDIVALSPLTIDPVTMLGFYAELNEMGLSHLE